MTSVLCKERGNPEKELYLPTREPRLDAGIVSAAEEREEREEEDRKAAEKIRGRRQSLASFPYRATFGRVAVTS